MNRFPTNPANPAKPPPTSMTRAAVESTTMMIARLEGKEMVWAKASRSNRRERLKIKRKGGGKGK